MEVREHVHQERAGRHPQPSKLESFMRSELPSSEAAGIVRHLLTGCPNCTQVTRRLWRLGEPPEAAGSRWGRRDASSPRVGRDEPGLI